jgi:hypothetical protein
MSSFHYFDVSVCIPEHKIVYFGNFVLVLYLFYSTYLFSVNNCSFKKPVL